MLSDFLSNKWVVFCLLVLVIFSVFGRTIWFDYVQLDEGVVLVNNQFFISKIANIFEVFKHDINYPSAVAPYYRPIFTLSFMLNSQFDRLMTGQISSNPLSYHFGNLLLHIAAVFLIFGLLRELGVQRSPSSRSDLESSKRSDLIPLLGALIFAVHPAVTPVVAWVPGRIEAILTAFIILSFICFIRFLRTADWRYLIGFLSSFAVALLTKEVAVALLPVLFFYYLTRRKEKGGELMTTLASGLGAILVAWFFVRKNIIAAASITDLSFSEMLAVWWSNSSAIFLYLGKTLLPFDLTVLPVLESSTLVYGFAALAVIAGLVLCLLKSDFNKPKSDFGMLGLVWFIVFLAPSLVSYNSPENMVFFEHRLYLPMIGILMFFSSIVGNYELRITNLGLRKRINFISVFAALVFFGVLSFNYSGFYRDKTVFWQKAVADSPQSFQAHNGLATAYLTDGKDEEAMAEFTKTLEINPQVKRVHLLLGLYYLDQNQYDKAKTELEKEIEIDPQQFVAYHGLGRIYAQSKNLKEAEKNFLKTLELNRDYVLARQDLVVLYFSQNKHPQAIANLKELLKIQRPEAMHPQILKIVEIYAKEAAQQIEF